LFAGDPMGLEEKIEKMVVVYPGTVYIIPRCRTNRMGRCLLKRIIMSAVATLLLALSAGPAAAEGLSLVHGKPLPVRRSEGGLYGQKKAGGSWARPIPATAVDSVDVCSRACTARCPTPCDLKWLKRDEGPGGVGQPEGAHQRQVQGGAYALLGPGPGEIGLEVDSAEARATLSSTEVTMKLGGGIDILAA